MTALANLSALVASWRREADDMERAGVSPSTTLAIRANADELDAAITTLSARASAGEGGELARLRELSEAASENWTKGRHGVLLGGAVQQFERGSGQTQIAMFTSPNYNGDESDRDPVAEQRANTEFALACVSYVRTLLTAAPQPAQAGAGGGGDDGESALWALRQILHDLPERRDWLDPRLERLSRGLVERNPYADLSTPASPATGDELTADFTNALPSGKLDASTFGQIEDALDRAEAPMQSDDGRWLTLPERITALTTSQPAADAPTEGSWIAAADVRRLAREIDVALNGEEGAARAPALCDIAAQVKAEARKLGRPILATPQPESARGEWVLVPRELVKFLNGDAPLDGHWYGDRTYPVVDGVHSPYWWRKYLNAAAPQPQQKEPCYCRRCHPTLGDPSAEPPATAPCHPQQAPAQEGDAAEQYRQAHNAGEAHGRVMAALEAATPPAHGDGEGRSGDFYGNGSDLPNLHPDPLINAEILIQSLCARLDTARKALADAAAMQVVQPALQRIKANAAWAMNETAPSRVEPRTAKWNPTTEEDDLAMHAKLRDLLAGKSLYVMGREHFDQRDKPLYEIVFGMAMADKILFSAKDAGYLTTRPTPEAQEARDAARYRAIRNAGWEPNGNAALFAAIETAMTGEQLDDCIDAALALPAQGEGNDARG